MPFRRQTASPALHATCTPIRLCLTCAGWVGLSADGAGRRMLQARVVLHCQGFRPVGAKSRASLRVSVPLLPLRLKGAVRKAQSEAERACKPNLADRPGRSTFTGARKSEQGFCYFLAITSAGFLTIRDTG